MRARNALLAVFALLAGCGPGTTPPLAITHTERLTFTAPMGSVSCATPTYCVTGTGTGIVETWNGTRWSKAGTLFGSPGVGAVSCPEAGLCYISVGSEYSLLSHQWLMLPQQIAGQTGFTDAVGISCPDPSFCMSADVDGTIDEYDTATAHPLTSGENSTSTDSGDGVTNNDESVTPGWYPAVQVAPSEDEISGISCVTSRWCAAMDENGGTYIDSGKGWQSAGSIPATDATIQGMSCAAAGSCVAISGRDGDAVLSDGTWKLYTLRIGTSPLAALTCSSSRCEAVTLDGLLVVFERANVLFEKQLALSTPQSIACPTAHLCMATDEEGHLLTVDIS